MTDAMQPHTLPGPSTDRPPRPLNEFQRNSLRAGFRYLDRLLAQALDGLSPANEGAIFAPTMPDATPTQRKVIGDQAARLRRALRSALAACGVSVPPPDVGALWNLRCALTSMQISLEEMSPGHLRGYGAMDAATGAGVDAALARIRDVLNELQAYLAADLGGNLALRLDRLDRTCEEVRLLREIERMITAHGLVELRGALTRLLDRLERNWWTVAFIGRVSCGKSSLLNRLLDIDLLPAGVTPITAVPVRIAGGAAAAATATIHLAAENPRKIPARELVAFASETHNPGNVRHVTDILLELPAGRLNGDMCFVDTPGLGSLATAGAAQTLAFLPRCDLGVLLLDAAGTPGAEDIDVARTLLESGAEVLLGLSKADLVAPPERETMLAYVRHQFGAALGRELSLAPLSIRPGHEHLVEQWFTAELLPRQARHRELAATGLRRKIGALKENVAVALELRTGTAPAADALPPSEAMAALNATRAAVEAAGDELQNRPFHATPSSDQVIGEISRAAAASPANGNGDGDFRAALALSLGRIAARLADGFEVRLREIRETVERTLVATTGARATRLTLPQPAGRPLFDPAPLLTPLPSSGAWRRWPSASVRGLALHRRLRARIGEALDRALQTYARVLADWARDYLAELMLQYNAEAGLVESRSVVAQDAAGARTAMRRDLQILRQWNVQPAGA